MSDDIKVRAGVASAIPATSQPIEDDDDGGMMGGLEGLMHAIDAMAHAGQNARERATAGEPSRGALPAATAPQVQKLYAGYARQFAPKNPDRPFHHLEAFLAGRETQRVDIPSAADAVARLVELSSKAPYDAMLAHISATTGEHEMVLDLVLGGLDGLKKDAAERAKEQGTSEAVALRQILAERLAERRESAGDLKANADDAALLAEQLSQAAFLFEDDIPGLERDLGKDIPELAEPRLRRMFAARNSAFEGMLTRLAERSKEPGFDVVTAYAAVASDWADRLTVRKAIIDESKTPPLGR